MEDFSQTIAKLLGVDTVTLSYFSSGDLSSLYRVDAGDGRILIAKGGPDPLAEAGMLRKITESGAPAPSVIAVNSRVLIMEEVGGQSGASAAQADLGRVLNLLHSAKGAAYGWDCNYAFGPVTIHNEKSSSWVHFWRDNRLLNNVAHVPAPIARRLETLASKLSDIIPDTPAPALLHGDLWSGNVMSAGSQITALIDPASYYGDGEVDLAMFRLFGQLSDRFYAQYLPLTPGFEERQAVYSLWPALVHLRLFGGGYRSMVEGFLSHAGV